ncbi:pilin [Azonexus sp.]|uniref:pilin n=1 Tax=Azonexus sp. TaxID=1872668 RepID=UPI0035B1E606
MVRSRISEGLARGAEAKTSVAEFFSSNSGTSYGNTTSAGFNSGASGQVKSVKCTGGKGCDVLDITMSSSIKALYAGGTFNVVSLSATSSAGGIIVWKCRTGATNGIINKYLPASCR